MDIPKILKLTFTNNPLPYPVYNAAEEQSLLVDKLQKVLSYLKATFIGKDDIIDLMGICLTGRENLFLLGPPGTAKSAIVRELAKCLDGKTFEYLLTRFTEPNELFGPFDIRKLREGDLVTNTEGMLPEASLVFLDELLNANSAILNSLLMALNEKIFRRGRETRMLPALMFVGASNHLPEDETLQALFDRFLIRVRCDYVDPNLLAQVLQAGWQLEKNAPAPRPAISAEEVKSLQTLIAEVDLQDIRPPYLELIFKLRNAGLAVSDRRAVRLQNLIAASALLSGRLKAGLSDMWVLRYIWDTEAQQEVIAGIVNSVISTDTDTPLPHPRALLNALPDAEQLHNEVSKLSQQWQNPDTTPAEKALIKDRLRYLNGRCEWIANPEQQAFVQHKIDELWNLVLKAA